MMYYGHAMGGGWALFLLVMVAPLILLSAAVTAVVLWPGSGRPSTTNSSSDAEKLLGERFARGEIGTDDYEQRLRALRAART